jgi:hypothetical protein
MAEVLLERMISGLKLSDIVEGRGIIADEKFQPSPTFPHAFCHLL